MHKFEIYYYNGMFFHKKDLETMGFKLYSNHRLFNKLKEKQGKYYSIYQYYSKNNFQCISLELYFQQENSKKTVFFKDFGRNGMIISFQKYYGIQIGNEPFLFESKQERTEFINHPEIMIHKNFDNFYINPSSIHMQYKNQNQQKQNYEKLKQLFPNN